MFFSEKFKSLHNKIKEMKDLETRILNLNKENNKILQILEGKESAINKKLAEKEKEIKEQFNELDKKEAAIQQIINEKSKGFPWLAKAIAEFHKYQDYEIARYLEKKKHPALKKADEVRAIAKENKELRTQLKIAQNYVSYYESLFPWITEYIGESLDDLLDGIGNNEEENESINDDPVLKFVPLAEFSKLSETERNQKALDRYLLSKKRPFEIGRDYERYIGYEYEVKGYEVEYQGIEKGLEDLGRDLVCTKNDEIEIVQCKYWASHKVIREKHVNQLYGTAVKYYLEHSQKIHRERQQLLFPELISLGKVKATLITSTKLSEKANEFASALGVRVIEEKPLGKYPLIKCNVSANGDKIYHLPFDLQYDKTRIKNKGEFYASTVIEAEQKGFRRAFRWKGMK